MMNNNNRRGVLEVDHSKAGMQGVDKEKVNKIVNELSKNSPFYQNEQRKQENREKRIAKLLRLSAEFDNLPPTKLNEIKSSVDNELENEIFACAHVARYAHCDMDAFHAAVEELDNPSLKNVPFGVGGSAMLGTSNYEARKYGVRAAMPGYIAKQLCPQLVLVEPHYEKYEAATKKIRAETKLFDPDFVSHGGDELCIKLDRKTFERAAELINERNSRGKGTFEDTKYDYDPEHYEIGVNWKTISEKDVITELQARIFDATKLTASVGVGPTRTLAKISSNFNKPNGQTILECRTPEEIKQYTWDNLSVRQIPGIGKVSELMLDRLGIKTCKEMYENRYRLRQWFLPKTFSFLLASSVGLVGAVKSSNVKKRHSGFFVKHPSLKKKLEAARGGGDEGNINENDNAQTMMMMNTTAEQQKIIASQRSIDLDFSSSDAESEDDKNNEAHENPHRDNHKHSVGCERTFRILENTKEKALQKIDKVFSRSVERLMNVTPCRIYQITIKAKKTDYSISNSSTNVQVLVNEYSKNKKNQPVVKEEEPDRDDDSEAIKVKVEQDENNNNKNKKEGEDENYPDYDDDDLDIMKMIEGSMSVADYEMMKKKFTQLCEQTGFLTYPSRYRLLGCRFSFQPGLMMNNNNNQTETSTRKTKSSNNNNNKISSSSTLPERRQRTIDDFFSSVKKKQQQQQQQGSEVKQVIELDDDEDEDDCCMMMMNPKTMKNRAPSQNQKFMVVSDDDEDLIDNEEEDDDDEDLFMMMRSPESKEKKTTTTTIILTNSTSSTATTQPPLNQTSQTSASDDGDVILLSSES